jgi:hypothetical protein
MTPDITYGELYHKLHGFGFAQREIEMQGKHHYVFEHEIIPNAMIILPKRKQDQPVEPFHMNSVLTTLKTHDLLPKRNPLTI